MAIEIQAPNDYTKYLDGKHTIIFAGGSIEMDKAKPWQKRLISAFRDYDDVVILNPRRGTWHASWKQVKSNKNFNQQVTWELAGLEDCHTGIMYFDPATKSPISLMELGLFGKKLHVICPPGFWRKGNVDVTCDRYGFQQHSSLTKAITYIKAELPFPEEERPKMWTGILRSTESTPSPNGKRR